MSYVKQFKEYDLHAEVNEGRVWVKITRNHTDPTYEWHTVSGWVYAPTFIEHLLGITWQDKLEKAEKKLFKKLLAKAEYDVNTEAKIALYKFLNTKETK